MRCLPDQTPENYITKGLNQKLNYLDGEHSIIDLEYNIPIQVAYNEMRRKTYQRSFRAQRKIYQNSSRSLGIELPNIMRFPITRIDILFWSSI